MKIDQVAAQLYTVREMTQTLPDFVECMKELRRIGFTSVQVSSIGPIADEEVSRVLAGEGLSCCVIHAPGDQILQQPQTIVERLDKLNCKHVAYPHPGSLKLDSMDTVKAFAEQLEAAGKVIHEGGKVLSYHNHSIEFQRIEGQPILAWLYELTDPRYFQAELDTYWVQYGGGDPAKWCALLQDRLPLLHMKDYRITEQIQPDYAEIGNGNLDWPGIILAAEGSGCEWFIIEQDECRGNPLDSLQTSFEFTREHLCRT